MVDVHIRMLLPPLHGGGEQAPRHRQIERRVVPVGSAGLCAASPAEPEGLLLLGEDLGDLVAAVVFQRGNGCANSHPQTERPRMLILRRERCRRHGSLVRGWRNPRSFLFAASYPHYDETHGPCGRRECDVVGGHHEVDPGVVAPEEGGGQV
jgi:hypothetical protein